MSIRLDTVQTLGRNLKSWFRLTVPLICVARYLSDRPIDWLFFFIGWRFLRSSTIYLFGGKNGSETVDSNNQINHRGGEVDCFRRCCRSESISASKTCSTPGGSHFTLAALPSVVLTNVACYLHPRDVLDLDTVIRSSMGLQSSEVGDKCNVRGRRQYGDAVCQDIWKRLWYRDYGDVLLRWKVSREAFLESLTKLSPQQTEILDDNDGSNTWLEEQLSKRLDFMAGMKDFYFVFGECYIDYVLARKNTILECFLGLHGHIFDFTNFAEYHPGLIEPILKECGGNATEYFEDLPHSSAARNIARRLCVVVDHSVIDYDDYDGLNVNRRCGLEFVLDDDASGLKDLLRLSNTRPPPPPNYSKNNGPGMADIVPRRRQQRRHPTLERIRIRFQQEQRRHEQQQSFFRNCNINDIRMPQSGPSSSLLTLTTELISTCSPFGKQRDSISRYYYDPLRQSWIQWYPDKNSTCFKT